ncbi:hypothetical protein ET495_01430 [Xylanimonas allomyrinae]|uniref:beta-N-acetylhexosaminidase n=1 Tax=Xylanimonas allomyrinae TaxID=2509459 RepID=A0A4P6EVV0_9MICO|nr:family 20 glycosylhydrolase [Xylanimonas allomyrinae]QAY62158.1 hypothetical protein ET495_01430 [Xylanimonas allomyrinae]
MNDRPHRRPRLRPLAAGLLSTVVLGATLLAGTPPAAAAESRDVARTAVASAASEYPDPRFSVGHVNDGDPATRWGSRYTRTTAPVMSYDPSRDWVQLKLAEPTYILKVVLDWEAAYPTAHDLMVSKDGATWTTLATVVTPTGAATSGHLVQELHVDTSEAYSYVRVQAASTATRFGLSLYRFEVWDTPRASTDDGAPAASQQGPAQTPALTPAQSPQTQARPVPDGARLVPAPAEQTSLPGAPFRITSRTRIVAEAHEDVAQLFAAELRTATGYALPVVAASPSASDIVFRGGAPVAGTAGHAAKESYRLTASARGVEVAASTGHGAFNATRTLLQLLPVWVAGDATKHVVDWAVPPVEISDHPRFAVRGLMLDPARNFIDVDAVKAVLDEMAAVKLNRLHLHLTDDQGWRLQIDSWPRLTGHGASASMKGGIAGHYTKADFAQIVRYAAARYIEVVPEIDVPGHSDAALSSYPELGCTGASIPIRVTGGISRNALCVTDERTYAFIDDVLREVAEISPSEYIHIGADEAEGVSAPQYAEFVRRVEGIAARYGKRIIAWTPVPAAGPTAGAVHQYWADRKNKMTAGWFAGERKVILSPTERAYLDYRFAPGQRLGFRDPVYTTRHSYAWDPTAVVDQTTRKNLNTTFGLAERNVLGIEGALWGETLLRGLPDIEYMAWPRLAGLADKAWAPQERSSSFDAFAARLAPLGARLQVGGTNFWADPQVPWTPAAAGLRIAQTGTGGYDGPVATIAAPGVAVAKVRATVHWGDGSTSPGVVAGTDAVDSRAASLFTVSANHAYAAGGTFAGAVEIEIEGRPRFVVPFCATVGAEAVPATPPVTPPATPPATSPVTPSVTPSVTPPEAPPVTPSVTPPATPEAPPVTPEAPPGAAPGTPPTPAPGPSVTPAPQAVVASPPSVQPPGPRVPASSAPVTVLFDGTVPTTLDVGKEYKVTVSGLAPRTAVRIELHSRPVELAAGTADANGVLTAVVRLPATTVQGTRELHVVGTGANGSAVHEVLKVTVRAGGSGSSRPRVRRRPPSRSRRPCCSWPVPCSCCGRGRRGHAPGPGGSADPSDDDRPSSARSRGAGAIWWGG